MVMSAAARGQAPQACSKRKRHCRPIPSMFQRVKRVDAFVAVSLFNHARRSGEAFIARGTPALSDAVKTGCPNPSAQAVTCAGQIAPRHRAELRASPKAASN